MALSRGHCTKAVSVSAAAASPGVFEKESISSPMPKAHSMLPMRLLSSEK